MKNAMDNLIERIIKLDNPTVMGLDPSYEKLPSYIIEKYPNTLEGVCQAILEFNQTLMDATYDIIPAIKPQIAFYEKYGIAGMKTFLETCHYAKQKGMIVIADIKRGDIGSTVQAYSDAYLGRTRIGQTEVPIFDVDFITVNPYLGTDGIKPFLEDAKKYQKGMFILVKTSNPSSGELQNLTLQEGKTVYEKVAQLVNQWAEDLIGEYGYSCISAVVGATYPKELESLRKQMPHSYFLIPGYGAQGGKAQDIALGFDQNGLGGIVNASRSLMYAFRARKELETGEEKEFAQATRKEAIRMKEELNQALKRR